MLTPTSDCTVVTTASVTASTSVISTATSVVSVSGTDRSKLLAKTITSSSASSGIGQVANPEIEMGQLRSGKIYSPSRASMVTPRVVHRRLNPYGGHDLVDKSRNRSLERVEKRKLSGSPPMDMIPVQKRQGIVSSDVAVTRGALCDQMEIGAEVEITGGEKSEVPSSDFMSELKAMMSTTLDKITNQAAEMSSKNDKSIKLITDKSDKCLKGVESLREVVDSQGKSISALQNDLRSVRGDISSLNRTLEAQKASLAVTASELGNKIETMSVQPTVQGDLSVDAEQRIEQLERRIRQLENSDTTAVNVPAATPFSVEKTIMMVRVYIKDGMTPIDVARLVIHDALRLKEVQIVNIADMGVFNGRHSLKVELGSTGDVRLVMEQKACLSSSALKDLRSVFIRRSKTPQQRVHDHNQRVMMRAMKMEGKYVTDRLGRLRLVAEDGAGESGVSSEQDDSNEEMTAHDGTMRDRGRGRGKNRRGQRGRGGGYGRGRGRGSGLRPATPFFGPERPPLQVSQSVIDAFSRPSPVADTDHGGSTATDRARSVHPEHTD